MPSPDLHQSDGPSDKADALIRASVTPEARRVIRADVIAEIVEALRQGIYENPATGRDRAIPGWKGAADFIEREFGGQQ